MRTLLTLLLSMLVLVGCRCNPTPTPPGPPGPPAPDAGPPSPPPPTAQLIIMNNTKTPTTAFVSFGSDSTIKSWPACSPVPSGCSMPLAAGSSVGLPTNGQYLNATISFGAAPSCGNTKAEINLNNPAWSSDTADVSLVDGYDDKIQIDVRWDSGEMRLGPPLGETGNEQVFGLFPKGCDICVARQSPPCGQSSCGSPDGGGAACGCKDGTQYNPKIPCQYSRARGATYTVILAP